MNRRRFLYGVTIGLAVPCVAEAQQAAKLSRIGFLSLNKTPNLHLHEAFRQALRDLGYVEGRNLVIEYRDAEGKVERLPALAAELVALKVDLIVTGGGRPRPWPPNKRPGPSRLFSRVLPIRLRTGSSPAFRGQGVTSRGRPISTRRWSENVWSSSRRPFRG